MKQSKQFLIILSITIHIENKKIGGKYYFVSLNFCENYGINILLNLKNLDNL